MKLIMKVQYNNKTERNNMRYILLDVETTGLSTSNGDRIVEIAMLEVIDDQLTGNKFHSLINPQREIPDHVIKIHGITNEQVKDEPIFENVINDIKDFIKDATIIAHNAAFDMKFLNHEFDLCLYDELKNSVLCTRDLARIKVRSPKYTLDALCDHFSIDRTSRDLHGAMLDCELLAEVYFNLLQI